MGKGGVSLQAAAPAPGLEEFTGTAVLPMGPKPTARLELLFTGQDS